MNIPLPDDKSETFKIRLISDHKWFLYFMAEKEDCDADDILLDLVCNAIDEEMDKRRAQYEDWLMEQYNNDPNTIKNEEIRRIYYESRSF